MKPEKVANIENALIGAAQQGKLRAKVSETELVSMLETQTQTSSKITVPLLLFSSNEGVSMTSGDLYILYLCIKYYICYLTSYTDEA